MRKRGCERSEGGSEKLWRRVAANGGDGFEEGKREKRGGGRWWRWLEETVENQKRRTRR